MNPDGRVSTDHVALAVVVHAVPVGADTVVVPVDIDPHPTRAAAGGSDETGFDDVAVTFQTYARGAGKPFDAEASNRAAIGSDVQARGRACIDSVEYHHRGSREPLLGRGVHNQRVGDRGQCTLRVRSLLPAAEDVEDDGVQTRCRVGVQNGLS